jgi:hypothetical protein
MARLLIAIRGDRRQVDAARIAGVSQAKVSRAERGHPPPLDPAEAQAYATALGAAPDQIARVVELARLKTEQHAVPRQVMLRNAHVIQERILGYVRSADVVRSWTTDAIPGALQTRAWTEAMLGGDGEGDPGPAWWAAREAHVALLDDPTRRWHVLLAEGALRWIVGSTAVQAAQIRHIIDLSRRSHIDVGVIDLATPKPFIAAYGFLLYGAAAEVATDLGASFTERADDLAFLRGRFDVLDGHAHHGDDARTLLERVARSLGR